jgi:1-deoxy-D-xylulose-5-phosphate reductoisomerase
MDYPQLTFEPADAKTFKNLELAYQAMELGGNIACALNAANEISVQAFLEERISFLDIARINETVMEKTALISSPNLEDYVATDMESRNLAEALIGL